MLQNILINLWERRTTVLGYVVTALGIMATSDLFTSKQIKWFLLVNGIITAILGHYNNRQEPPPSAGSSQGGFARVKLLGLVMALTAAVMIFLGGCSSNPVNEAESFDQRAFALYGSYVIFQGKAAELKQDAATPQNVKDALSAADAVAYPISESLVDAAVTVSDLRDVLNKCPEQPEPSECTATSQQQLAKAILNLSGIYYKAQPQILNLISVVKGAN